MVHTNNKNNCINALHRVTKMLKPLLRLLTKRSRAVAAPQEDFTADCNAENAANEALEARLRHTATTCGSMVVLVAPSGFHAAPDRDIACSDSFSSCSHQCPEQQSPSPRSVQQEEQPWW